jgi:abortive infection bacteriophage resistance protein
MKFTKPSLTIQQQIEKLQGRGMIVGDLSLAAHCFQHISYYRLRAYWLPFEVPAEVDGEHQFAEGTAFEDAVSLYVFDRQLRLLVMDAIERIEVSLRGAWAYRLATQYGSHGYLDPALYARSDQFARALNSLLDEIDWSKDTFIKHYKSKYDDPEHPPVWMVSEVLSLGQLSKWFSNLKARADRQAISKVYGLDEKVLTSAAHHLTYVRNICAHHGRLWNKQFTVTMIMPSAPSALKLAMNPGAERKLYNTLSMLGYLMGIVAPTSDWRQRLRDLLPTCEHAKLSSMGFPENWLELPAWKPQVQAEPEVE